jgi:hypothetical protein
MAVAAAGEALPDGGQRLFLRPLAGCFGEKKIQEAYGFFFGRFRFHISYGEGPSIGQNFLADQSHPDMPLGNQGVPKQSLVFEALPAYDAVILAGIDMRGIRISEMNGSVMHLQATETLQGNHISSTMLSFS